jgi:hypothetical protein
MTKNLSPPPFLQNPTFSPHRYVHYVYLQYLRTKLSKLSRRTTSRCFGGNFAESAWSMRIWARYGLGDDHIRQFLHIELMWNCFADALRTPHIHSCFPVLVGFELCHTTAYKNLRCHVSWRVREHYSDRLDRGSRTMIPFPPHNAAGARIRVIGGYKRFAIFCILCVHIR